MTQSKNDPIMLDLETLGTSPNSVILSIGACRFDPDTETTHDDFYVVVRTQTCLDIGCKIDSETVKWWDQQTAEARIVLEQAKDAPYSIQDALLAFSHYADETSVVWGNGADFDNAILQELYRKTGMPQPWKFWNNRCYRTVKNMIKVPIERQGVYHNALDDAKTQAVHLMKILAKIRK